MANNGKGSKSPLPSFPNGKGKGRPTVYSQELADRICEELSKGNSLRSICRQEGMPQLSTVMAWLFRKDEAREGFVEQYQRAREAQAEVLADGLIELSDPPEGDQPDDNVAVNRSRLRVDTRKWVAARLLPRRYGDRVEHAHTGNVNVEINLGGPVRKAKEKVIEHDSGNSGGSNSPALEDRKA